ncbi:MAG: XRE family transcriptional regulator [Anaerolineae bacterium]|nr:XRE family transcriptional regulator [Anaerolineae bacterium]
MRHPPGYTFKLHELAADVRAKRGERSLRDVAEETQISIATLSRVENAKMPPDFHNFGILCHWLDRRPQDYFELDLRMGDDPIVAQLRAAQEISVETAGAFAEVIRAAYDHLLTLEDTSEFP